MRADPPPPGEVKKGVAIHAESFKQRHRPPYRWRFDPSVVTLAGRSCVARQEPYIPGALSILQGTVPGQVRGLGHMVPTYFRRELRDRALQRPSRLRTFVFVLPLSHFRTLVPHSGHTPRKRGIQYAAASRFYRRRSGILDRPLSRAMTNEAGDEAGDESEMHRRMSDIPASSSKADLRTAALTARDALSEAHPAPAPQAPRGSL